MIDSAPGGHHAPYALELAHGLRDAGHHPCVVGPASWCDALGNVAEAIVVDPGRLDASSPSQRRLHRHRFLRRALDACVESRADVAHVLYLDGSIAALSQSGRDRGLAVVATLHWTPFLGLSPRRPKQALKGALALAALWRLDRAGVNLVVHSRDAQARLARFGLSHVHAVDYPSAVAEVAVNVEARACERARLGVDDGVKVLLCFGGTRYDKGVDLAIAALADADPDVRLLIAGAEQDFDRSALLALAARFAVEDRLLLRLGHVADSDVVRLFSAVDAVLLPYRGLFSGQSGPMVTAGSLGVPIIASDAAILAETVTRFDIGRVFRADDRKALAAAMRGDLPRVDASAHRRFAAASSPRHFAARNLAVYESARAARVS